MALIHHDCRKDISNVFGYLCNLLRKSKRMYQVTSDYAQNNFNEILDRASQDPEGVAIVQANKSFVLISQEELEGLIETIELVKDPTLLADIQQARQEYKLGEVLSAAQVFS